MKTDDPSDSTLLSRSRRHHRNLLNSLGSVTIQRLIKPAAYFILLLAAYAIGYASNSHPTTADSHNSHPMTVQLPPSAESKVATTSDDIHAHNNFNEPRCGGAVSSSAVRRTLLDKVFDSTNPWEEFPPPHAAAHLHGEWTKGWGSQAAVFEHLIDQVKPKTIIEVGTFLGASAIHMSYLNKKLGLNTQIICIDDFRGWPGWTDEDKSLAMVNGDSLLLYQFMQNVATANATGEIMFLPFSASTALTSLCEWGIYGDLVEVDAAHDFHSAWVDINNAYKVLRPGGVLFGHDIVWVGVNRAVHMFAKIHGFQVKIDGEHWILY